MKKWISGLLLAIIIVFATIAMPVKAEEAASSGATVSAVNPITNETITTTNPIVNLDLEYDQTEARKALEYINEFRTSETDAWAWDSTNTKKIEYENLTPIQYDYGLEKVAMQRAAELSILTGHIRPTGESYITAFPIIDENAKNENSRYGYASENNVYRMGYGLDYGFTAQEAITSLREDNKLYDGQGHRRTMLNSRLLYVGVGHVIRNGNHYYALAYRETPTNSQYTNPVDGKFNVPIEFKSSFIANISNTVSNLGLSLAVPEIDNGEISIDINEVFKFTDTSIKITSKGMVIGYTNIDQTIPIKAPHAITNITSSNPEVVKVMFNTETNSYEIQRVSSGEAEITTYTTVQSGGDVLLPSPVEVKNYYKIVVCDHEYANERILCYPTCTAKGEKKSTCIKCGKTKIETIPEEEHDLCYNAYYDYDGGQYHRVRCAFCNTIDIKEEHTFSSDYIKGYSDHGKRCTKCYYSIYEKHVYTKEPVIQFNGQRDKWEMTRVCDKCGEKRKDDGRIDGYREEIIDCTSPRNRILKLAFHIDDNQEYVKEVREEGYYPPLGHHFTRYEDNGDGTHIEVCGCCYTDINGDYVACDATGAIESHEYNQYNFCSKCYVSKKNENTGENSGGTTTPTTPTTPTPPSNIPVPGDNENGGGTAGFPTNTVPSDTSNNNSTSTPSSSQIAVGKTELSQIVNTSAGIELTWNKADNTTNYIVYRRISNNGWTKIATVNSNVTKYTDKAVKSKNGTFYGYRIQTVNKDETGEYSEEKNICRLTGAKLTSAKNNKSKKAVIKWKKVSKINGYEIQYSTSKNFKKATTKKVNSASKKEYTISKLTKGKTYYIRLRTYKTVNKKKFYSAWSSTKKVKIKK